MIISCENCHTRFKFDSKRLRPAGVKLRCSKCQHTFEIKPLPPSDASPETRKDAGAPTPAAGREAPSPEEVVLGSGPGGMPGGRLDDDEIERAVDAALSRPEGPVAGDMNQAEGVERAGRAEDLFGAPPSADVDGPEAQSSPHAAPSSADPRERSEDFDWDHVSFQESKPAAVEEALRATEEMRGLPESESLELDMDRPQARTGRDATPAQIRKTFSQAAAGAGSSLDLARSAPDLARASGSATRKRPPADETRSAGPEAPVRIVKPLTRVALAGLTFGTPVAARPKRPSLVLPLVPTLAASIGLGLLVALVSAFTIYAPKGGPLSRTPALLRADGSAGGTSSLRLDDLSGRLIGRDDAAPLYAVTGKARWSATPKGTWFLDGVLVDRGGRVLQRRPAKVGSPSAVSRLLDQVPGPLAQGTSLPATGESGFLILFAPQPTWKADVRFEVRRAH